MKTILASCLLIVVICLSSCKTYYISKESLKEQFSGIDSSQLKDVTVKGPIGENYKYKANPIKTIRCVDKNNNPVELANGPSIEMRVTHNGKKSIFYFDRVFVNDSVLIGAKSRFIKSAMQTIYLSDINKIEVQDGGKNYRYVE